ncbi:amidohydrolase [Pseudoclavibacter chungangensis]|uniref:Amidohydrolase n=1 Tax=Pseudoclavibacter chungangensis TaxID=587635 RepID=A0A7J5BS21_9MICO|nr:amidohydrolase [Pseudoclavibacter chungangensis]KAB1656799.1 amidohydrolase [Pseudoclavibacter chungangensis]NYJ67248.1 amidohydrolase [Pseudoclavibacter chungangensis]
MTTTHDLRNTADALRAAIDLELPAAEALRWAVHRDPRVSHQEEDTATLAAAAIDLPLDRIAGTGRITRLGPAGGGGVLLRAELDGLPVTEATGAPDASTNGVMHACGHDVHLAALVAVVRAAATIELPVGLVPFLQPSEESYPSGALEAVEAGALDRYGVTRTIGAHVHPRVPIGAVSTGAGVINAAADELRVTLVGRGGHGAYPHDARDVVSALASIALGLPEVVRRTVDQMSPAVVSIGTLSAGEGAANVLPGTGRLRATMRTTSEQERARLIPALERFVVAQGEAYGIDASFEQIFGEPVLRNDAVLADLMDEWLPAFGLVTTAPMRSLGADDFAFLSDAVPSVMSFVGVRTDGVDPQPSLHDPRFLPADGAVAAVAHALAAGYVAGAQAILAEH